MNAHPGKKALRLDLSGAAENNLKNISCSIPLRSLTVITGPSGSGKSTLGFQVIHQEAQRRIQNAAGHRNRLGKDNSYIPKLESASGLSFTLAIKPELRSSYLSTLATFTGIYDSLRVVFFYLGKPFCKRCFCFLREETTETISLQLLNLSVHGEVVVCRPIDENNHKQLRSKLEYLLKIGFTQAIADSKPVRVEDLLDEADLSYNNILLIVDIIPRCCQDLLRIKDAVSTNDNFASDKCIALITNEKGEFDYHSFREGCSCPNCNHHEPVATLADFSYYSKNTSCSICLGKGNEELAKELPCKACSGTRLKTHISNRTLSNKSFGDLFCSDVCDALKWVDTLDVQDNVEFKNVQTLDLLNESINEIKHRLVVLSELGLDYLSLNRSLNSLSSGECTRVSVARGIGNRLEGVTYIIDEPTLGLHPSDTNSLLKVLRTLVGTNNSLLIIEHDEQVIRAADYVIELGPGAGKKGGNIVYAGRLRVPSSQKSEAIGLARTTILESPSVVSFKNLHKHNIIGASFSFPLRSFVTLVGKSGSGKSTLLFEIILPTLKALLTNNRATEDNFIKTNPITCEGWKELHRVVDSGEFIYKKNERSTVATLSGALDHLRDIFSSTPLAKLRGFNKEYFSYNNKIAWCDACLGKGGTYQEIYPSVILWSSCVKCLGKRYSSHLADILVKGFNLPEVLSLTVEQCLAKFSNYPKLARILTLLCEVGLEYLSLNQTSLTLSNGEMQRLRLVKSIALKETTDTLFLFDEPTRGLSNKEIDLLYALIRRLIGSGASVLMIEHNTALISKADYIIEMGPGGGSRGGKVIALGTLEEIRKSPNSLIGSFL